MQVLITTPLYDRGTHYLHAWSQEILNFARKKGVDFKDLDKSKVTKNNFQKFLEKQPVEIVIINGHGNYCAVAGDNDEIILAVGDGDHLFKDKTVFIRACSSGLSLGPALMQKGAAGFIGYKQDFIFPHDPDYAGRPLEDPNAAPVLECSNQVALSLVRGRTAAQAQEDSMKKYEEIFDKLSSSNSAMTYILPFLLWNMDFQVQY